MSDYNERACTQCGSLLHHESRCPVVASALAPVEPAGPAGSLACDGVVGLRVESVNNLLMMWDFLAAHWKETADLARRDGREQAETIAQSRGEAYQLVCKQLRAEMEAATERQPEENTEPRNAGGAA